MGQEDQLAASVRGYPWVIGAQADARRDPGATPVKSPHAMGKMSTQDYGPTLGTKTVTEPKLGSAHQLAVKPI